MESKRKTDKNNLLQRAIIALIVDDETGAINTLNGMLNEYCPDIHIGAAATSVSEAIQQARQIDPDVVFLDIEMPPMGSGFDFLKAFPNPGFGVIFTTAYPQYAIQAINTIQPWAYLVKPYSVSDLKKAVNIAEGKISERLAQSAGRLSLIIQDSRKGSLIIRADKIVFCEADGSFTDIYVLKNDKVEKIVSSRNLGEYESVLPESIFCRTHHSYLVNLNYVERFERTGRNGLIHLRPQGHQASVSVSKMDQFLLILNDFTQLQNEETPT